ncbi:sensor c-di-GMP phosphodiesterase, contains CSS-motif sensor and EAL domain [Phyllobacterium sp. OV277]|nr:sensor c-di-GMP phosphodiesterase, contains CSS-motif sensor and EAL domain [Phyllobacterium sp. OV277]
MSVLRPSKWKIAPQITLVVILVFLGCWAGSWIGRLVIIRSDRGHMLALSNQLLKRAEKVFNEADLVLSRTNGSEHPFCSEEEVDYLRNMLFETKYLKDIGRVKDGAFHCSAVYGPAKAPSPLAKPDLETDDGILVYANTPLAISSATAPIIGNKNANVVLDPTAFDALNDPIYSFGIMFNPSGNQNPLGIFGTLNLGLQLEKLSEGAGRDGDIVFRNVCNARSCVTLHAKVRDLEDSAFPIEASIIGLGGALGGAVGVIMLLLQQKRLSIGARLTEALDRQSLTVEYQPIIDIQSNEPRSAEALVRWIDNGEAISPDIFIPVAEEEGLIGRVTLYVIDRVFADMGPFLQKDRRFRINVNISASDLIDPEFVPTLANRLKRANIQTEQLGLEITERSTANAAAAVDAIHLLRSRGHRIYIDDFGTGYSSLAYLGELNVDGIKMDKSFTQTVGTGSVTVSIVPQIIEMARVLGLSIIVEGIETAMQRDYFAGLKTEIGGQGWFYGRPVNAMAMQKLIQASSI